MYLKHRYQLGYETLVGEVADSLSWRRFYRLALDAEVPHSTTLLKLTRRFGPAVVEQLNAALLATGGFGNEIADEALAAANILDKVIPRVGRADPREPTGRWRRRYRFRAGIEGRISAPKRGYGIRRSRLKGHAGVRIWVGFGILANNLDRMAALA